MIQGFCNYKDKTGHHLGILTRNGVVNSEAIPEFKTISSTDALMLTQNYSFYKAAAEKYLTNQKGAAINPNDLNFLPCVLGPEKILVVGLNYKRHAEEVKKPVPATPMIFGKFNNALAAHNEQIPLPIKYAVKFDYEVELVIVIGKECKDVSKDTALSYVFGYCVGNDLSARDLQNITTQYLLGKGIDKFAPIGPWLVPSDVVGNPDNLNVSCTINSEKRQSSNTSDMIFSCADIVSYCSQVMTLRPGDIIFTGTPEGCITGKAPTEQKWLKAGDVVVTEIEKLGTLRNELV
jgi:2-keto-4-pentenoate hydratase/2-oxohepta-3-ene-1,7-dioic acid hydratase in catechol pathway